jgi:hypothetical protein
VLVCEGNLCHRKAARYRVVIPCTQHPDHLDVCQFCMGLGDNKLVWPIEPQYKHLLLVRWNHVEFQLDQD